jgi:DNA-directed RNA polymerase II subunit RPB1
MEEGRHEDIINRINSVQFGILSDEDIKKQSNQLIDTVERYTGSGELKLNGLDSPRIRNKYGHIELVLPIFHPLFFDNVKDLLKITCVNCASCLVPFRDDLDISKVKQNYFSYPSKEEIKNQSNPIGFLLKNFKNIPETKGKTIKCHCCNTIQPKYKYHKLGPTPIPNTIEGYIEKETKVYNPEYCYNLFEKITEENLELFNFNEIHSKPSSMILHSIPVVPSNMRKSRKLPNGSEMVDRITETYENLIRINKDVNKNKSQKTTETWRGVVSSVVFTLVDNKNETRFKITPNFITLGNRIQGAQSKNSRVLETLLSRRVQNCGRAVIIPDPAMDVNQVGIPQEICYNLTFPIKVNPENIGDLKNMALNDTYPKINFIEFLNTNKKVQFDKDTPINIGDIVHRNLINDDMIILNRQPSLHKFSMMGFRVFVHPNDMAIRLNPNVTEAFNADFDGDEMNLHVPQSIVTTEEIKQLSNISKNTMSSATNQASSTFIQDNALAFYNLYNELNENLNMDVLTKMNTISTSIAYNGMFEDFNKEQFIRNMIPKNIDVPSKMNKSIMNGLTANVFHNSDNKTSYDFFNNIQKVLNSYMKHNAFSVSPADSKTDSELQNAINEETKKMYEKIRNVILQTHETGDYDIIKKEIEIAKIMGESEKNFENFIEKQEKSRFKNLISSKSKGKMQNMLQIKGTIAQQIENGSRIGITKKRNLVHSFKYDEHPSNFGYIKSTFSSGFTPDEYFFHAIAAREGIIEQALSTGESGYIQKQLVNFMQDVKIGHNNMIVDSSDRIYGPYGNDNFDGKNIQKFDVSSIIKMSEEDFKEKYYLENNSNISYKNLINLRKYFMDEYLRDNIVVNLEDEDEEIIVKYPINIKTILEKHTNVTNNDNASNSLITSEEIEFKYQQIITQYKLGKKFHFLLLSFASPKILLEKGFDTKSFYTFIDDIEYTIRCCFVDIGEPIGLLAATSIGEPTTQLTLNSFHNAGSAGRTGGVPRIKELFRIQKNKERTSFTTLHLKDFNATEEQHKQFFEKNIKELRVKDLLKSMKIIYCKDMKNDEKNSIIKSYIDYSKALKRGNLTMKYLFIMELQPKTEISIVKNIITKLKKSKEFIKDNTPLISDFVFIKEQQKIVFQIEPLKLIGKLTKKQPKSFQDFDINKIIKKFENFLINGIDTYSEINVIDGKYYDNTNFNFETKDIKISEIVGSNLKEILAHFKTVDQQKTFTNNIIDTYNTLGVEATVKLFLYEANRIFEKKDLDVRHLLTVIATGTQDGNLIGLQDVLEKDENGEIIVNKTTDETLEDNDDEDVDNNEDNEENSSIGNTLTNAASQSLMGSIKAGSLKGKNETVSSNIEKLIIGQSVNVGTGMANVSMLI